MTTYEAIVINNGTRLRNWHDVFSTVIDVDSTIANVQSFNANDKLEGDEVWEAPADGVEVKKGDKWIHVTKRNGNPIPEKGWTAVIHKGVAICHNLVEVGMPPIDPPVVVEFPQSVVWEYVEPSTNKTVRLQYVFDKPIP
jgi:hypothetical protein